MTLQITPELEEIVQNIFRSGRYESESDVLREALNLLRARDQLRKDIFEGIAQLDRGERVAGNDVIRELDEKAARIADHPK